MTTKIYHRNTPFDFGQYQDSENVRHVIEINPAYITWVLKYSKKMYRGNMMREFVLDNAAYNQYLEVCADEEMRPWPNNNYTPEMIVNVKKPAKKSLSKRLDVALVPQESINQNQLTEYKPITLVKGIMNMKNVITVCYDNAYQAPTEEEYVASGKGYSFLTTLSDLKKGEYVVVNSGGEMQIARVIQTIGLTQNQINRATAWVVTRVDISAHVATLKKQELVQEVRNKLQQRKAEMEEMVLLKALAQGDPGIRSLLGELAELDPDAVPAGLLENEKSTTVD